MDLSRDISVGLALSYLSGTRTEDWVSAHGIPNTSSAERECEDGDGNPYVIPVDEYGLFYGCGLESEKSLFKQGVRRTVDASGWTGSLGILGHVGRGFRLAGVVNLPRWLQYQGTEKSTYEDYISSFSGATGFVDDITLPMSVRGGASWAHGGFLAAADMLWTDWKQIDFEGDIRAPDRTFAYRSTVALGLGAEYQIAGTPLRVRGGYRLDPLPYELITADGAVDVVASTLLRNYPRADITSDRTWLTLGGGVIFPAGLTLDIAYLHGSWERKTGSGFAPPNGFVTREKVTQNRVILTTAVHFQ
jgi:hypothetical protein